METLLTDAGAKPLILHDWYLLLFMILTGGFGETAEKPTVFRWFVLEPIPICAIITPYLTIFNSLLLEGWRKKGVIAMVVVDIRNVFAVRNVEIIETVSYTHLGVSASPAFEFAAKRSRRSC